MLDRAFVLLPLSRIAPDLRIAGRTIGSWLAEVPQDGIEIADEASDWWRPPLSPPAMPA
jgi:2-amino-4-hydroxy-6-hydroxymethyldihydropteridine diphosphokinase